MVVNVQGRKDEDLDPGGGDEDGENSLRGRMGNGEMLGTGEYRKECGSPGWSWRAWVDKEAAS